jgi:hypothetical protein
MPKGLAKSMFSTAGTNSKQRLEKRMRVMKNRNAAALRRGIQGSVR